MTKQRYKMTVAYDGTDFNGWQVQSSVPTVQGKIEQALAKMSLQEVKVHGSGRTDAGVHAVGQVAHFDLEDFPQTARKIQGSLNGLLPETIRVSKVQQTRPTFHARRCARSKEYRFHIWNGRIVPPYLSRYRTLVSQPLDRALMQQAADGLVGTFDFAAFSANSDTELEGTVRTLSRLHIGGRGHEVIIRAVGNGFLYKMVRSLGGFLIRVGYGALPPESAREILDSRLRTAVVPTAPAKGLFLWNVKYR